MAKLQIGTRWVGEGCPTYFIAEVGSNHEGDFGRAVQLIRLAKESGANAVKFQHYKADLLASKYGFDKLQDLAHYKDNPHTVFTRYETPERWTSGLKAECDLAGIEFLSTPYDLAAVDHLNPYVNAFKIGSGDITYTQLIRYVADKGKPIFLATGASDLKDVLRAMQVIRHTQVCIMQCNTNYTGGDYSSINLRVLEEYKHLFPYAVLGLSDHTTSITTVLGAVTLGAKVIEKHFTDNPARFGPDHGFATTPDEWKYMVAKVRQLEQALGDGNKRVEANEQETVVLQRRCLRASQAIPAGTLLTADLVDCLRPAPKDSLPPYKLSGILYKTLKRDIDAGDYFRENDFL